MSCEREECLGKQREKGKSSRVMKGLWSRSMMDRYRNKKVVKLMGIEVKAKRRRNQWGTSF